MSKLAANVADPLHLQPAGLRKAESDPLNLYSAFDKPKTPDAAAVPSKGPSDAAVAQRAGVQMATRGDELQRQAQAAGATRSDNDADLLGYNTPKKKAASRMLLGE